MRIYVGQTRAAKLVARLQREGVGECCLPDVLPPRRTPWFLDNGAFVAWRAGTAWDERRFAQALERLPTLAVPDFVVAPDVVGEWDTTLARSRAWLDRLAPWRPFLAVQDGAHPSDASALSGFAGIFVGGTLEWKRATAATWCELGRRLELPVHVGRCVTPRRLRWAWEIGATSVDGNGPLWERAALDRFLRLRVLLPGQGMLWGRVDCSAQRGAGRDGGRRVR